MSTRIREEFSLRSASREPRRKKLGLSTVQASSRREAALRRRIRLQLDTSLRLEPLQVGHAVVDEGHRVRDDPVAGLLGDQSVHLLGDRGGRPGGPGYRFSARSGASPRGRSCRST